MEKNYLFELLDSYINVDEDRELDKKSGQNICENIGENIDKIIDQNIDQKLERSQNHIIDRLKYILLNKTYKNPGNIFSSLNFTETDDFVIISTNDISDNLRHTHSLLDKVLHQTQTCLLDKTQPDYPVIVYLEKCMNNTDNYLTTHGIIQGYDLTNFDHEKISFYKNYIGTYFVLFYHKDDWYFLANNLVNKLTIDNSYVLYESIASHLSKLDKNLSHHIVLVDFRLKQIITYPSEENNFIVHIKSVMKYDPFTNVNVTYDFMMVNKRIYISSMDELTMYLEEIDMINVKHKKLLERGIIMKCGSVYINYDTATYKRIINQIPKGLSKHETYLKLYQIDKLNMVLPYISDSHADIVKRINLSMSTMSREILDIYHMTRNQHNSILYDLLPQSYRKILYNLHNDYILQKNSQNRKEKIAISVDNVYNKLKEIDVNTLIDLYIDRDTLSQNIIKLNTVDPINPIKQCIYTKLQTKLLSAK